MKDKNSWKTISNFMKNYLIHLILLNFFMWCKYERQKLLNFGGIPTCFLFFAKWGTYLIKSALPAVKQPLHLYHWIYRDLNLIWISCDVMWGVLREHQATPISSPVVWGNPRTNIRALWMSHGTKLYPNEKASFSANFRYKAIQTSLTSSYSYSCNCSIGLWLWGVS